MVKQIFTLSFLMIIALPCLALSQVTASVSQNPVLVGDIFVLEIEADDSLDPDELDTRVLQADFDVSRPSVSRQQTIINGKHTQSTTWSVSMRANAAGTFTIAPLTVAGKKTNAIQLEVIKPDSRAVKQQEIFVQVSTNKNAVYVGEQLEYETKLYLSVNLENGNLSAPKLNHADIAQIGQDEKSIDIRGGIKYSVITRRYTITPTKSGNVKITAPVLEGESVKIVPVSNFSNRMVRSPVIKSGPAINLEVKSQPAHYKGQWMISDNVLLTEEVQPKAQAYQVGQPITRTITLVASEVSNKQLPELKFNYPADLRFYPDKDEVTGFVQGGKSYGQRLSSHAIIPSQAGSLVLPEIRVPWWDSTTDSQQVATIPERILTISAADLAPQHSPGAKSDTLVQQEPPLFWQLVSTFFAFAWLTTLFFLLKGKKPSIAKRVDRPVSTSLQTLKAACQANSAPLAYQSMLRWVQEQDPRQTSLAQFNHHPELTDAISELQKAYATNADWTGKKLLAALTQTIKSSRNPGKTDLASLNPQ